MTGKGTQGGGGVRKHCLFSTIPGVVNIASAADPLYLGRHQHRDSPRLHTLFLVCLSPFLRLGRSGSSKASSPRCGT